MKTNNTIIPSEKSKEITNQCILLNHQNYIYYNAEILKNTICAINKILDTDINIYINNGNIIKWKFSSINIRNDNYNKLKNIIRF